VNRSPRQTGRESPAPDSTAAKAQDRTEKDRIAMSMLGQFISRIELTTLALVASGALPLLAAWLIYKQRTRCRGVVIADHGPESIPAYRDGDVVVVEAGQCIPADGRILEGVASVDESAVSGVSVRVLRGEGTDCREVLAGSVVVRGKVLVQGQHAGGKSIK